MNAKKRIASAMACAIMCVPVFNNTASVILPVNNTAIIMEADAASCGKRSGKCKAYISSLTSVTICLNTDKQIAQLIKLLEGGSYWTSGAGNGKLIADIGAFIVPDPASKVVLMQLSNRFRTAKNFSKIAGNTAKKLKSVAYNPKNLKKGIKLTIYLSKEWTVQTQ